MTLPEDVIEALRARDRDLAQAVVAVVSESNRNGRKRPARRKDTHALLKIAPRRFLITVDRTIIKHLPGCELVPIGLDAAFVALEPGRGLADLALAVVDRLEEPGVDSHERDALLKLRAALRVYVRDKVAHETRSIIMVLRRIIASTVLVLWNCQEPIHALLSCA
jgi:hypothetical protein